MSREGRDVGEMYKIILDSGSDRLVSLGRKAYRQKYTAQVRQRTPSRMEEPDRKNERRTGSTWN